jgi:hypothetical protein
MPVDGTGSAELLLDAPTDVVAYSVSSDSRWLVYREGATIVAKAGLLDLATPHAVPTPLTIGTPWAADISPDGRFLAYAAADTPKQGPQIYVCTLPDPSRGRWQLTETGGVHPVWARDGRKLYYATSTVGNERGAMMAVDIRTAPTFEAGPPREVVRLDSYRGFFRSFDVAPGPRFLVLRQAAGDERAGSQVVLVHNFADELRRLAPIE